MKLGLIPFLLMLGVWAFGLSMTIYGLYLAFSASVVLGIVVLVVEPSPAIIGLVMFFFEKNLAQLIVDYLTK